MPHLDLSALNQRFALPGQLDFRENPGGLVVAEINNTHGHATLFLQGAHLTDWTPHGQEPVIWLSPKAMFAEGKAIRGGIPVCWPWFGAHTSEPDFPAHGYARITLWEVTETAGLEDGTTRIALHLPWNPSLWPYDTPVEFLLTVGKTLGMELTTRNQGTEAVVLGQALHAYFQVGDVRRIEIGGLDGCPYVDKLDGQRKKQMGPVAIGGEVDRIYLDSTRDCVISDPGLGRRIRISKRGSHSTIVWNPWVEKASQLGDLGDDGHLGMVCVESANAAEDVVNLHPGMEHRLWVEYSLEALRNGPVHGSTSSPRTESITHRSP